MGKVHRWIISPLDHPVTPGADDCDFHFLFSIPYYGQKPPIKRGCPIWPVTPHRLSSWVGTAAQEDKNINTKRERQSFFMGTSFHLRPGWFDATQTVPRPRLLRRPFYRGGDFPRGGRFLRSVKIFSRQDGQMPSVMLSSSNGSFSPMISLCQAQRIFIFIFPFWPDNFGCIFFSIVSWKQKAY